MRRTLCVAVLVLALCCPASAGVIHNPPPAPLSEGGVLLTAEAEPAEAESAEPGPSDTLTEFAFELLAALPALF